MSSSSVESSPSSHSTRLSNAAAIKCAPLQNPRTQDVFQSIVKGRKSWKTLRGGEVVWPPELEAALIEGLENYQPDDSRETRLLGRFPMRNRFISDWIFRKTGKRRTAKQVGSRLQQLRDTCGGKRLLNLLSPNRRPYRTPSQSPEYQHRDSHMTYGIPPLRYGSESGSDSSLSSPTTPTEAHATLQSLLYRGVEPRIEETPDTIVYIDLLRHVDAVGNNMENDQMDLNNEDDEHIWMDRGYKVLRASQQPRHIEDIDATITLMSPTPTSAKSYFTVYTDESKAYSEVTDLELLETSAADGSLLYTTSLVPGFWSSICRDSDASKYVIIQRVVQDGASSSASTPTIFSAMYRFKYVPSSPSSHADSDLYSTSPVSISMDTLHKNTDSFGFDLISMDPTATTDNFDFYNTTNQKSQGQGFVDMPHYMNMNCNDWSGVVSPSAHHTSVMMGGEHDQQLLVGPATSFSMHDIQQYSIGS